MRNWPRINADTPFGLLPVTLYLPAMSGAGAVVLLVVLAAFELEVELLALLLLVELVVAPVDGDLFKLAANCKNG